MRPQIHLLMLLSVVALALCVAVSASRAAEGPWCARFGGGPDYFEDCSMRSFDMCLNEIRGTGGSVLCSPNPRYRGDGALRLPARRVVRNRRHRG
jgi:hypothetical protein